MKALTSCLMPALVLVIDGIPIIASLSAQISLSSFSLNSNSLFFNFNLDSSEIVKKVLPRLHIVLIDCFCLLSLRVCNSVFQLQYLTYVPLVPIHKRDLLQILNTCFHKTYERNELPYFVVCHLVLSFCHYGFLFPQHIEVWKLLFESPIMIVYVFPAGQLCLIFLFYHYVNLRRIVF
jgi:hypothetical protein